MKPDRRITKGEGWEIREYPKEGGEHEQLDEVVATKPDFVHLESMGGSWCLILYMSDGTVMNLTLYGKKNLAKGFVFELSLPKTKKPRRRKK